MDLVVRPMTAQDWQEVREIYVQGINTGNSTFESEVPTWEKWDAGHLDICRLVACLEDRVLGWAALSPVSSRCVYSGVAEVSIYVASESREKGIGSRLMQDLIACSEQRGIWTLEAGTFPENTGSLQLLKKCGFREIGTRERLAKMRNGQWRDVALLERRSRTVGTD